MILSNHAEIREPVEFPRIFVGNGHKGAVPFRPGVMVHEDVSLCEPGFHQVILRSFHEGDTFFDIGAHTAQYTKAFLDQTKEGSVIAVDMNPALVDSWPIAPRLVRVCACIAQKRGVFGLHLPIDDLDPHQEFWACGSRIDLVHGNSKEPSYFVASVTLDDLLDFGMPTLAKIDIEGAEYEAVMSSPNFFESVSRLCLENHWYNMVKKGLDHRDISHRLRDYGLEMKWAAYETGELARKIFGDEQPSVYQYWERR